MVEWLNGKNRYSYIRYSLFVIRESLFERQMVFCRRLLRRFAPTTIDMCWAVILNPDSRDEESLSSVATFEEILLPPRRDQNDRFGFMSLP